VIRHTKSVSGNNTRQFQGEGGTYVFQAHPKLALAGLYDLFQRAQPVSAFLGSVFVLSLARTGTGSEVSGKSIETDFGGLAGRCPVSRGRVEG
jgi:hypothetical protein